jgi:threonine/homoserine/homoserine lactone efflux protein
MPDLAHLSLFLVATIVVLLPLGPAVFYIIGRSLEQGGRAGLVSVLSVEAGNFWETTCNT